VRSGGAFFDNRPLVGSVSETKLRVYKNTWQRRSGRFTLVATLEPHGSGTILRGRIGLHPFGVWVLRIQGAICAAGLAFAILASVAEGEWRNALLFAAFGAVAAGIISVVVKAFQWAYSVDPSYHAFFKRVLGEAIDAREV
jgi:hypothetical protein